MYLTPSEKWVRDGHLEVIPCIEEHRDSTSSRTSRLLFLLLVENINPSGTSLPTAEPQTREPVLPGLHRYGLAVSNGNDAPARVCRARELQDYLMVLILIALQVSGGLIRVFYCYPWQTTFHTFHHIHTPETLAQNAHHQHVAAITLLFTINTRTVTLNIQGGYLAEREGPRYQ